MATKWDTSTQQFHGGQEWASLDNFVSDFSVTTNGLGTPASAVAAAQASMAHIHHYPAADFEPAKTDLANFLAENTPHPPSFIHDRLLLGNGASELIDLVTRLAPAGGFKSGSSIVQYKEYERASVAHDREVFDFDFEEEREGKKVGITAIINPNNPTGEWMELEKLKQFIRTRCPPHSFVMVDESMELWVGNDWRSRGLLAALDFVEEMAREKDVHIFLMHSWTKIWSCPGIRLGSVLCPSVDICRKMKKMQVPWSVNTMALAFLSAAVNDRQYFSDTLRLNKEWRQRQVDFLTKNFPSWKLWGEDWLSWIWCELPDVETQEKLVSACRDNGTPCRSGANGYNLPKFVRFGVRTPEEQDVFFKGLLTLKN